MDVDPAWYDDFFESEWLDLFALTRPPEQAVQEVEFVVEQLGLETGARVLDLACGHGRHSLELARRGFRVTGVDLSPRSLELARRAAEAEALELEFVRSDMREIAFDDEFDAALNLFTAFGYFEREEENQRVLEAVARALRPGGAFLIDVINPLGLARRYQTRIWEDVPEDAIMLSEHDWDVLAGRNVAVWRFVHADGTRGELRHSVRMYAPWELASMLERAGLPVERGWGDFEGTPLSHESRRLILLGRRRG
jgi:SAM-dependent methyltransferase